MPNAAPHKPTVLTTAQVAAELQLETETVEKWRQRDRERARAGKPPLGPPYYQVGRSARYPRDRFEAWLEQQLVTGEPQED